MEPPEEAGLHASSGQEGAPHDNDVDVNDPIYQVPCLFLHRRAHCPLLHWLALRGDHLSSLCDIALYGVDVQAFTVPHEYESFPRVE